MINKIVHGFSPNYPNGVSVFLDSPNMEFPITKLNISAHALIIVHAV